MRHFFQIISSFLTFTFHKVVQQRVWGVAAGVFNHPSLHVYCWVRRWKNFENRSTYGKVMSKSIGCPTFLTHEVRSTFWTLNFATSFFFHSILRWSVAVSTMRRQSSVFLQAEWQMRDQYSRSQVWLCLPDGCFHTGGSFRITATVVILLRWAAGNMSETPQTSDSICDCDQVGKWPTSAQSLT